MLLRVITRHSEDFDLFTPTLDPARSTYANGLSVRDYVSKVRAFYDELGVQSAMWTSPESPPRKDFEFDKPVEYLLEVEESRVLAYVNELTWSPYLYGERSDFVYSITPVRYEHTSILVATPIRREEVKELRRYRRGRAGHCELVEKVPF